MDQQPERQIEHLSKINARIRAILEKETLGKPLWAGGLVRNHFVSDMGHEYFSLVEGKYSIRCMVPESVRGTLGFSLQPNMEVEVFGTIRVYEPRAQVEIEVEKVKLVESALWVDQVSIEEQLAKKSLWPPVKRPLPANINKIALLTSKQSEALDDFKSTYADQGGTAFPDLVDVRIQGEYAPREIADAITRINREGEHDVIALVRGGGRSADLAIFSDLLIAEAICRSQIFVVTGIGHQQDKPFADRVADKAEITPTAAAYYLARGEEPEDAADLAPSGEQAPLPFYQQTWFIWGIGLIAIMILLATFLLLLTR